MAIASLVVVLALALGALSAMVMQVRCIDAAREAARLAARGDDRAAADVARRMGPEGSVLQVHRDGTLVVARIAARSALLPGLVVEAEAVAAVEPGQ